MAKLYVLRSILCAIILAFLLLVITSPIVHAQSWSSASSSEFTSIHSEFIDGTYFWTLTNKSSLSGDPYPSFDVLVWELIPFQVQEPLSVISPSGWTWAGSKWKLSSSASKKYYTPNALGPGMSIAFKYTPDPNKPLINYNGMQPQCLGFITHVAAVVPGSGSNDGEKSWTAATTEHGGTWYDSATISGLEQVVPEPSGMLVMAVGFMGLASFFTSRRKAHSSNSKACE